MKYKKLKEIEKETLQYENETRKLIDKTNLSEKDKKEAYDLLIANSDIVDYMNSLKEIYREKAEEQNNIVDEFNNSLDASKRKILKEKATKISKELKKMRMAYADLEKLSSSLYPIAFNLKSQISIMAKENRKK